MKKLLVATSVIAFILTGCAYKVSDREISPSVVEPTQIAYEDYTTEVKNVYVVLDASSSMDEQFNKQQTKFMVAKIVTDRISQALPNDMKFSVLRTYGHDLRQSWRATELIYKAEVHNKTDFSLALEGVKYAGGPSPLPEAFKAVEKDIANVEGRVAIILISDGVQLDQGLAEVATIKQKYGDKVCFHTIFIDGGWTGQAMRGRSFMSHVARLGLCGFAVDADKMVLDDYIKAVFLKLIPDTDMDGVRDNKDQCMDTPIMAPVSAEGCWVLNHILFDFDQYKVKAEYEEVLKQVASVMLANPNLTLVMEGHTDNVGMHHYNYELSVKRAEEAKNKLVAMGVPEDRIDTKGFSFMCPADTNETEAGRANNRRVEIDPSRK